MNTKKKLTVLAFILLLMMAAGQKTQVDAADQPFDKLTELSGLLRATGTPLDEWRFYAREKSEKLLTETQMEAQKQRVRKQLTDFEWKTVKKDNYLAFKGIHHIPESSINERVEIFFYPHNNRYYSYSVYGVKSEAYQKGKLNLFSPVLSTRLQILFHNPECFTTVSGTAPGSINQRQMSEEIGRLINGLQAKPVEWDNEQTFVSVSAYTGQWKSTITSREKKINLQVAIRSTGRTHTFTIGTPIITTEY